MNTTYTVKHIQMGIFVLLNDRPLKCLNWRTPREAFTALLHRYLLAAV